MKNKNICAYFLIYVFFSTFFITPSPSLCSNNQQPSVSFFTHVKQNNVSSEVFLGTVMVKKSEEFYVSEAVYKIVVYSLSGLRERNLDFWVRTTIERDKTCVLFGHLINSTNGFVFRETLEVEFKRVGEQKSTKVNGIKILIRYNHTYSLGSHRDRVLLAFIISTKEKQIMLGDIVLIESETTLSVNSVYKAFLWIEGVLVLVYTVTATSRSISTLEEALERIFNKRMRLFGAVMRILIPIIVIFIFFVIRGILEVIIQNVAKIIQKTPS